MFGRQTPGMMIRNPAGQPVVILGVVRTRLTEAGQPRRPTIYYGFINIDQSDAPRPIRDAHFRVPVDPPAAAIELSANIVSAGYFFALDMPSISGQNFPGIRIPGQGRVAVINQEAADLYFSGKPLGAGVIDDTGLRTEIIGVVKSQVFGTFEQHAAPTIYFPMWQDCPPEMTLLLKNSTWNRAMAADLRRRVESVPGRGPAPAAIHTSTLSWLSPPLPRCALRS